MMKAYTECSSAYAAHFTERSFWRKVKATSCKVGEELLMRALALYYALQDPDTPRWARSVIISALGYFILPLDAIPDIMPIAGFTDDAMVMAVAVMTVAAHVKQLHLMKAKALLDAWLGRRQDCIVVDG
jgi:uncharacterized membrane protein YkvA (DUF1232 family)